MLRPKTKITVTTKENRVFLFDFVNECVINTSWETFTDTAKIKLPAKLIKDGTAITVGQSGLINVGDKIKVDCGYFPNEDKIFEGFISEITPQSPLFLSCQDTSWTLKQETLTRSFKTITLKNLLTDILPEGVEFEAVEAQLGQLRLSRVNPVHVLESLKRTYGLVSWFRDGVLRAGLAYVPSLAKSHTFTLAKNGGFAKLGDITKPKGLIYKKLDQVKIKVNAISMLPDNKKIEVQAGDIQGDQRTLFMYNVTSVSEVKKRAEEEVKKFRYEGYFGSFETFGEPFVNHGDRVTIKDEKFPERDGVYLVDAVTRSTGIRGYKQLITLGALVSSQESTPSTTIISQ
jgi:hypothetical protein